MKETDEKDKSLKKKSRIPVYLSGGLVAALVIAYFTIPAVKNFCNEAWFVLTSDNETRIRNWVENFGWFGPILIVLAMIAQMFLLVIPSVLLIIVAVLAYGPIWGGVISYVAVIAASSVGYSIGKYLDNRVVVSILGKKTYQTIKDFLRDYGFWAVAITRLNPFLSNDAVSFVGGILEMKYLKFLYATILGVSPLILLICATGENIDSLKTGLLWGSVASIIIFIGYVIWDRKRKRKLQQ